MRQGQYWVPIDGEWYPVPQEAVIKAANPVGEAIVWYLPRYTEGLSRVMSGKKYEIFCFLPSDDV
jgi:hypothetical protein